jgi:Holliday junction resolvase
VSNKKIGNGFEAEFCDLLFQHGYWVHNLAQNAAGQPADVIAVKNGTPFLIDCKVCSGKVFRLSRIEDNQRMSMKLWDDSGNGTGWFAVKFGKNIYMVELWQFDLADKANLSEEWFTEYAETLEEWLRRGVAT